MGSSTKHGKGSLADVTDKVQQLAAFTVTPNERDTQNTTFGAAISDTDSSLRAGDRGPTLLQDFELREKITRFDHERIAERVVHARGAGAHGYFELYSSQSDVTSAGLFTDTSRRTPVFVRFSTVVGSRGSADTVRDVRGFATRFYTPEGNWDLVGNNIPVFFIQDGMKFPDVIHAAKPEPDVEIPQAQTAHDNFWDFISLTPETTHMALWVLSDRAIPRSYRMMQGFGVHTFTLVNDRGQRRFVKFHWRPVLGAHGLAWDEAQKLGGQDPDYHRRDLYDAIKAGNFPQFELGLQIVEEEDEHAFDFDLLDSTKLIPEELVPIRMIGRMTLDRVPADFFAEVEQVAFCTQNIVPGIGFSDDPLLQARNFSYLDTQLLRFQSPNFNELPINRPVCPVMNHFRDGAMRQTITNSKVNYWPNRFGLLPATPASAGAFQHRPEHMGGHVTRRRGPKFDEHYSQARLFYRSLSDQEGARLRAAAAFEVGKCSDEGVRKRVVDAFARVDHSLATLLADAVGVARPDAIPEVPKRTFGVVRFPTPDKSPALSLDPAVNASNKTSPATRRVALLMADGFDVVQALTLRRVLEQAGCVVFVVAPRLGTIKGDDGTSTQTVQFALWTCRSTMFDAVAAIGGKDAVRALALIGEATALLTEALKHYKPVAALGDAATLLAKLPGISVPRGLSNVDGVVTLHVPDQPSDERKALPDAANAFVAALSAHRFWTRDTTQLPA